MGQLLHILRDDQARIRGDFKDAIPTAPEALHCPPCTGRCNQGRNCTCDRAAEAMWSESCAAEGGTHRKPVPSRTHKSRPGLGVALTALPWVLAIVGWALLVRMN